MSDNPYQAPPSGGDPTLGPVVNPFVRSKYKYKPLALFALLITILIGFTTFTYLAVSTMDTLGNMMFEGFSDPNAPVNTDQEMNFIYAMAGVGMMGVPAYLAAGVLVCMFCYRANANVRSFGATGLETTPGWCAGWWFVPIMSLFKPFQAVREIFICSHRPVGREWRSQSSSPMLPIWWACWLIGSILGQLETRLAFSDVDLGGNGLILSWTSSGILTISGIMLIMIVRRINELQADWARKLVSSS